MGNPFDQIDERLRNIEMLLLDIKHRREPASIETTTEPQKRLYGDKAAAACLGCSVLTIAKLRKTGQISFYRYGARYYYIAQELDQALKHEARRFGELRGRRGQK
jgi:hypothetical protein